MANKKKPGNEENSRNIEKSGLLMKAANKLLGITDDTFQINSSIELRSSKFNEIINRNLEVTKGIAGGNVLDFAQAIRSNETRSQIKNMGGIQPNNVDLRKMMSTNSGEIYTYFQEVYQNKYIQISDLKFISKFIPALGEAVKCLLDSITNSDDLSGVISRSIQTDPGMTETDKKLLESTIESIEKDLKLQKKLKNIVYKTTLVSGKYYVYAISYEELFEQYSKDRAESQQSMNFIQNTNTGKYAHATEGYTVNQDGSITSNRTGNVLSLDTHHIAVESVNNAINITELQNIVKDAKSDYASEDMDSNLKRSIQASLNKFESELSSRVSDVKIIHSGIPEIVLDDLPAFEAYQKNDAVMKVNDSNYKGLFDSYFGSTPIDMEAGVVNSATASSTMGLKAEKNFKVTGTYLKFIDPICIIPVKLMSETIGYYYIQSAKKIKKQTNTNIVGTDAFSGAFNIGALSDMRKSNIIDSITNSISDSICKNFSKKFVAKNQDFKKAIADCITYNGFLDNEYHVQFIEPKHIIEFVINEDENGEGESVLADSLFPAKLLLSLITARMLNYLNLTGDKQVAYISKGPIDLHTGRQTQRVIRNLQETKITFSDLLSTNLVFNKFSRNKNMVIPQGRDGQRLVDLEVMEGQNIDMNPEYENKLENMAIMGTGVPSVIMEYIGQTDFARGFESGNIKYAARVSSLQSDLEDPTTDLYNVLVNNSSMDEDAKKRIVGKFYIKLNRPKTISVSNNNEYLGTLQQLLQMITNIMFGENSQDPNVQKYKDEFTRLAAKEYAPYIDWDNFDTLREQAIISASNPANDENADMGGESSGSSSGGFGF